MYMHVYVPWAPATYKNKGYLHETNLFFHWPFFYMDVEYPYVKTGLLDFTVSFIR